MKCRSSLLFNHIFLPFKDAVAVPGVLEFLPFLVVQGGVSVVLPHAENVVNVAAVVVNVSSEAF